MSATEEKPPTRPMRWVEKKVTRKVGPTTWQTETEREHEVIPRYRPDELPRPTFLRIYHLVPDPPGDAPFVSAVARMIKKEAKIRSVLLGDGGGVDADEAARIHAAADEVLGPDSGFPGAR